MKILLALIFLSLNLYANDRTFTYFKLNPQYKNIDFNYDDKIEEALLKDFDKICEEQTQSKIKEIFSLNTLFELGAKNEIGFDFSFSLGLFDIEVERKPYPDKSKNGGWIVDDKISIKINGKDYLKKLAEDKIITITNQNMGLFSKAYYKRTYRYQHRKNSYKEALLADYRYITHSYKRFLKSDYINLLPGEIISKEDSIGLSVGASATIHSPYFIDIIGGASIGFSNLHEVIIQKSGERVDPSMFFTYIRTKTKAESIDLSVGNDLIDIIYLTLINVNYTHTDTTEISKVLELSQNEINSIAAGEEITRGLNDVIKFRGIAKDLADKYQKSDEEAKLAQNKSKYLFLLWGKSGLSEKTHFDINNYGEERLYFAREIDSTSYLTRAPLHLISFGSSKVKYDTFKTLETRVEYATNHQKEPYLVSIEENISDQIFATTSVNIQIKKTAYNPTKLINNIVGLLTNYQNEGLDISKAIKSKQLIKPFELSFDHFITGEGLKQLVQSSQNPDPVVLSFCHIKNKDKMKSSEKECFNTVKKYLGFIIENYMETKGMLHPQLIKEVLKTISNFAQGPKDYTILLGEKGIFISGMFRAKTNNGASLQIFLGNEGTKPISIIEPYLYKY